METGGMSTEPGEEDINGWHRRFGSQANNRAWALCEQATRSAEEDEEMLQAAHASLYHWSKVGIDVNVARGRMLMGQVHALLGDGERALTNAEAAFKFVTSNDSPPWEVAFAHAVLANAAFASGNAEAHRSHYAIAQDLGRHLADAEDRQIFDATFNVIPRPDGGSSTKRLG
jgi:hypothetical protein